MRESNYIQHLDRQWELEKDRQRGYRLRKKGGKNQWLSSWGGTKLDNVSRFTSLHSFGDKSECLLGVYFTRVYNLLKTLKDLFLYSYFFPLYFMFSSFSLPLFQVSHYLFICPFTAFISFPCLNLLKHQCYILLIKWIFFTHPMDVALNQSINSRLIRLLSTWLLFHV